MAARPLPNRDELVDYGHAVAGHDGTMSDPDGELFIKPCTLGEIDFYNEASEKHPAFASIMPTFMGTLMLSDDAEASSTSSEARDEPPAPAAPPPSSSSDKPEPTTWAPGMNKKLATDHALVLENSTAGFARPNVLDVKLGVRLWADDAPPAKKQCFNRITAETTHRNLGFRISGMRVYRGSEDESDLAEDGYRVYDKEYGRCEVTDANVVAAFRRFLFNRGAGIDAAAARSVARRYAEDLRRVVRVLETEETRMYSASLLFVFEGDGAALRSAFEAEEATTMPATTAAGAGRVSSTAGRRVEGAEGLLVSKGIPSAARVDSGIGLEDEDFEDEEKEDEPPRIHTLKLIDFAHAAWTPGQGPDENSLLGVRSLVRIFDELAKEE